MKKNLLSLILFAISTLGFSQSGTQIDYADNFGPATCIYNGLLNGKHSYKDAGIPIDIIWSSALNRWEIWYNGIGSTDLLFHSEELTAMNPPDMANGNWQDSDSGDGTSLVQLSGTGTTSIVLPVELISFKAIQNPEEIMLSWKTASEFNNEKFVIEESTSGKEFFEIGEVKGNGTTFEMNDYYFTIDKPTFGLVYYRLKQIDFGGDHSYSKIVSINIKGNTDYAGEFYPNPSRSGLLNLDYLSERNQKLHFSIFDIHGRLVLLQEKSVNAGKNKINFNFSVLGNGVYFIKIIDGITSTQQKIIIAN